MNWIHKTQYQIFFDLRNGLLTNVWQGIIGTWMSINRILDVILEKSQLIIGTIARLTKMLFTGGLWYHFSKPSAGPNIKTIFYPYRYCLKSELSISHGVANICKYQRNIYTVMKSHLHDNNETCQSVQEKGSHKAVLGDVSRIRIHWAISGDVRNALLWTSDFQTVARL
jgi:hypothetical protein